MKTIIKILDIDIRLRFILFGIQSVIGITFSRKAIEKIFEGNTSDLEGNIDVSKKEYILHNTSITKVSAKVEEHEPEELILSISTNRITEKKIDEIINLAEFENKFN